LSPTSPPPEGDGDSESPAAETGGRTARKRHRHRKRRTTEIVEPRWRWWQLLAALGVALLAGTITILLVRGSSTGP
jgi:hypothetical protein